MKKMMSDAASPRVRKMLIWWHFAAGIAVTAIALLLRKCFVECLLTGALLAMLGGVSRRQNNRSRATLVVVHVVMLTALLVGFLQFMNTRTDFVGRPDGPSRGLAVDLKYAQLFLITLVIVPLSAFTFWQLRRPVRLRLAHHLIIAGVALGTVVAAGWFIPREILLPWTRSTIENNVRTQLIGRWEMADGSDYVIVFTKQGRMSIRNTAGEPQVLLAGDENLPYQFISETVVGVPTRVWVSPNNIVVKQEKYFLVFSVKIEHDRLTLRGQKGGETIILSQDGVKKVKFPGSETKPLEFVRQR